MFGYTELSVFGYTELSSMLFVLFVFHRTKHGNIVLEQGLREIFGVKKQGVAGE